MATSIFEPELREATRENRAAAADAFNTDSMMAVEYIIRKALRRVELRATDYEWEWLDSRMEEALEIIRSEAAEHFNFNE